MEIEKPKRGGMLAKTVVYGIVTFVCAGIAYLVFLTDFTLNITADATVSISGPLQVFVWALTGFVILVLFGSYAQVFGVRFLNSIGNAILDILDNYER